MFLTIPLQNHQPYRLTELIACLPISERPKFYILGDISNAVWVETNIQTAQNNDLLQWPSVCKTTWLYSINGLGHGEFYQLDPISDSIYINLFIGTGLLNPAMIKMAKEVDIDVIGAKRQCKIKYGRVTFDLEDLTTKETK